MSHRTNLLNSLKGLLYFGVLGPPIGSLAITVPMAIYVLVKNPEIQGVILALAGLVGFAFWSYFPGLVPALVVGAIAGIYRARLSSWIFCSGIGVTSALITSLFWYAVISSSSRSPTTLTSHLTSSFSSSLPIFLVAWLPAFFGGMVVARLFSARSNSSFKR